MLRRMEGGVEASRGGGELELHGGEEKRMS